MIMIIETHCNNGTRITKYRTELYIVFVRSNKALSKYSVTIRSHELKLSIKSFGKTPLRAFRGARKSINYEFFKRI